MIERSSILTSWVLIVTLAKRSASSKRRARRISRRWTTGRSSILTSGMLILTLDKGSASSKRRARRISRRWTTGDQVSWLQLCWLLILTLDKRFASSKRRAWRNLNGYWSATWRYVSLRIHKLIHFFVVGSVSYWKQIFPLKFLSCDWRLRLNRNCFKLI